MSNPYIKNLQHLGLNVSQAKIVIALVSEHMLTTEDIVEVTGISRTQIYSELKSLGNGE